MVSLELVKDFLVKIQKDKFYGSVTLKYEAGVIKQIKQDATLVAVDIKKLIVD